MSGSGSCSLLVFVDDATGRLMELRFVTSESAFAYFEATTSYLRRHVKSAATLWPRRPSQAPASRGRLAVEPSRQGASLPLTRTA
jgi:hypothetical protein